MTTKNSVFQFLKWADKTYPGLSRYVEKGTNQKIPRGLFGLGEITTFPPGEDAYYEASLTSEPVPEETSIWDDMLNFAKEAIPAYFQYENNKRITDIQLERAKQGRPPIDTSQYTAPPVTVQHEFSPGSLGFDDDTKKTLLTGAAILGALLLIWKTK